MASLTPTQYYDHLLNVVSGSDGLHDLQYKAAFKTGETFTRGSLVTIDANGEFLAGITTEHDMPMWAINAVADFDVEADVGNISGGVVAAFVATGGYEMFTTEFDADTYAPNDLLTASTGGDAGNLKLAAAAYNDHIVVGCVSQGTATDIYTQSVLYFWPMFIPQNNVT